jgi:hypothetical protein
MYYLNGFLLQIVVEVVAVFPPLRNLPQKRSLPRTTVIIAVIVAAMELAFGI